MIPRDEDTFECVSRERTGVWVGKPYDFPKDGVCVCVEDYGWFLGPTF